MFTVYLCLLLASVTGFSLLPVKKIHHISNHRLYDLKDSAREYISKLPPTLSTKEERATLISWYCRLRDLNDAQNSVPMKTLTDQTGLSAETIKKLEYVYGRLEERLLKVNLRLVLKVALQQLDKGLDLDDLMNEGIRGLKRAAEKFDNSKGVCFSTYAYPWIQVYIKAALASSLPITLPRHVYQLLTRVYAVKNRLYLTTGRQATEEELAKELGITMERFQIVRRAMALAERGKISRNDDIPVPYHESTWEATESDKLYDNAIDNVVSYTTQPVSSSTNTVISQTMYEVLKSLPQEENDAIFNRLMKSKVSDNNYNNDNDYNNNNNRDRNTGIGGNNDSYSHNGDYNDFVNTSSSSIQEQKNKIVQKQKSIVGNNGMEIQKTHYRKGMRRLRRNIKTGKVNLQDVPFLTQTINYI